MKLTNYMRDAFVAAVMNDVPQVDYTEVIRDAVVRDAVDQMPARVRAIWNDKALRPWIRTTYVTRGAVSVTVPTSAQHSSDHKVADEAAIAALVAQKKALTERVCELRSRLANAARGCTTRKQLAEALPEFEKYLPADEGKALRSLPVVANVVTEFVKAGWPKGVTK